MRWLLAALVAGGLGVILTGPPVAGQGMRPPATGALKPPFDLDDAQAVAEGRRLFQANCTGYCHGKEGRISRAPALRGRQFESAYLYARIAHGWPPMPAFRDLLDPEDIWRLVAYILSLKEAKE